jgi:type VI secretion system secreted protein VgrG
VLAVFLSQHFSVAIRISFSPFSLRRRIKDFSEYPANMTIQSNNKIKLIRSTWIVALVVTIGAAFLMPASTAVTPTFTQGSESTYGVLAGSAVTNTGVSTISGSAGSNVGVSTGTSIDAGISIGTGVLHSNDAAAIAAKVAFTNTYNVLAGATGTSVAQQLGGLTLLAGVHTAASSLLITGTLTLDAQNDANAVFIIQAPASTLTTAAGNSVVALSNGAQACNVYWQIGSSATLGTGTTFVGHIYANTSITATTGATIRGQLLAGSGAVTLDTNTIINDNCATVTPPVIYSGGGYTAPAPVQSSSIASINSAVCSVTSGYVATLTGVFPTPVANIAVNGNNIASDRWTQTATTVAVQIPPTDTKSFTIDVYNGLTPMLASQTFLCTEAVVVPVVVPTEIPVVTPTETGGELPKTSTNDYNYLLAGIAVSFLGASGVLLRKRTQK